MTSEPRLRLHAIVWGGLICGTMDISAALIVYPLFFGVKPVRLLQGIAAGLLGMRSFSMGLPTAALGLLLQYVIAFGVATVYVTASRWLAFLLRHPIWSGVAYGVAVYFFMNRIVVRLSAAVKYPFSFRLMVIGVVIHIFCVGLPVALAASRILYRTRPLKISSGFPASS
jgi:hypothetical protein